MRGAWLLIGLIGPIGLLACGSTPPPLDAEALVEQARARALPEAVQARFHMQVDSPLLSLSGTGRGGLQVERPGRGRLELFGPLGGRTARLASDGRGLALTLTKGRIHYLTRDGDTLLRESTGGVAGVSDLWSLLVGAWPFEAAPLRRVHAGASVRAVLEGPEGTVVHVELDPVEGWPLAVEARNSQQSLLLTAAYAGWQSGAGRPLPERVVLEIPALELRMSIRYDAWTELDGLVDYGLETPDAYAERSLAQALRDGLTAVAGGAGSKSP